MNEAMRLSSDWRHSPEVESRARALVEGMTLDEKVDLVTGDLNHMFGFYNAAVERVGIPELTMADGPPGVRINNGAVHGGAATALPAPVALAASWNPDLAARYGDVLGQEARASGHNVFLGPAVDIARVPVGGRNFESFGEDPVLAARIAASEIEAIQKHAVLACLKHFAANNQEYERSSIDVEVDEKTLRELYLLPFEILVRTTGLASLMGAFNKVNGVHACEHPHLLREVLREDWGFKGWVMSDYGATHSTVPSALAGLDQEQPSGVHYAGLLKAAVEQGDVPVETLDEMCRRIVRTLVGLGAIDRPLGIAPLEAEAHRAVAEAVIEEGAVLLKNDGLLPVDPATVRRVAVIGVDADSVAAAGGGSGKVKPVHSVSLLDGIRRRLGDGVVVEHAQGSDTISSADLLPGVESIPSSFLRVEGEETHGLRAEFWTNTDFFGEPFAVRVMPQVALNFGFFNFPGFGANSTRHPELPGELNGRTSVRFTGRLAVPKAGSYKLSLAVLGTVRVWLDDALVLDFRYHGSGRTGGGAGGSGYGSSGFVGGPSVDDTVRVPSSSEGIARALGHGTAGVELARTEPAAPAAAPASASGGGEAGPPADVVDVTLELGTPPGGHRLRIDYATDAPDQGFLTGAQIRLGWQTPEPLISHHVAEAVELARGADLVVVAVRGYESEHMDRPSIALPNGQAELVRQVAAANPRTVVVTMAGGAVDMRVFREQAGAILHAWYAGQEQGTALARLLFGDVNPSGKLPLTFPESDGQGLFADARQYPGIDGKVRYSEGIMVGYRGFEARGLKPLYPFGHGLSYTRFDYDDVEVASEGGRIRVACRVTNTGARAGAEVVQAYLGLPAAGQPPKRLADWRKVWLEPGASARVVFTIDPASPERPLSVWDGAWKRVGGEVGVFVGASSGDIRLEGRIAM